MKLFRDQLIPAFEKENPGVKVNVQFIVWTHLDEKLTVSFAGGVSPDVFQVGAEYVGGLAYRGQSKPIDEYVEKWGQKDDFYPASWSTCLYQGHVYGLPYLSAPRGLVYRKDLLKQTGYNRPPETWEELAEVASRMTVKEKKQITRAGIQLPVSWQIYLEFLWENGGDIIDSSGKYSLIDSKESIEALQYYCDLYHRYQVSPVGGLPAPGGGVPVFAAGQAGMEISNQASIKNVRKFSPQLLSQVGIAPMPKRKYRYSSVWTDWLSMSPQTNHPDLAWKLMTFLMEPDNLAAYNETLYFIPPRRSCKNAQFIQENPELKTFAGFKDRYGRSIPPIPQWFEIRRGLQTAVEQAVYGDKTPERALKDYKPELDRLLAETDLKK
jgi:multiple sugar transport system substrate-binding protein